MSKDFWADDLLNRKEDARLIIDFLAARSAERHSTGRGGAYVINLNAGWGQGKTFFLERLNDQLRSESYVSTYVNSWKDDSTGEPLVAVMTAIEDALKPHFQKKKAVEELWKAAKVHGGKALAAIAKGAIKKGATRFIGDGLDEAAEALFHPSHTIKSSDDKRIEDWSDGIASDAGDAISSLADKFINDQIDAYKTRISSIDAFKAKLTAILNAISGEGKIKLPMFVLIDELDRCRPTYAIETLEQIKHLFDASGIVFIIATEHSTVPFCKGRLRRKLRRIKISK